jgi:predicted O-methyltransferase YrrM
LNFWLYYKKECNKVSKFRRVFKYFIHVLTARNTNGFGVHSPYVYGFIQSVLKEKHPFYAFERIETVRKQMLADKSKIFVTDYGTGTDRERTVSEIAQHALKSPAMAQILFRIIHHHQFKNILELGTSLGISSMYMASASVGCQCVTVEGCPSISALAQQNFNQLGIKHIKLINCNIDESLSGLLASIDPLDFVFIDANHRYEPLMHYFEACVNHADEKAIFVIDDIYWSAEMEKAWKEIKKHKKVRATIDIYHMGIVFLNPMLCRRHYVVKTAP